MRIGNLFYLRFGTDKVILEFGKFTFVAHYFFNEED